MWTKNDKQAVEDLEEAERIANDGRQDRAWRANVPAPQFITDTINEAQRRRSHLWPDGAVNRRAARKA